MHPARSPAHDRPRPNALTALVALALLLGAAPIAAAEGDSGSVFNMNTLPTCGNAGEVDALCIVRAILGGFAGVIQAIFGGIANVILAVWNGIAIHVILPFLGIFGGFFTGLGEGLGSLGREAFQGGGSAFASSYDRLSEGLEFFGILAPIVAALIILAVIALVFTAVVWLFRSAVDLLPKKAEEILSDQGEGDGN